jgi:predicted lipid-binding transport protein (Tim44 family)
MKKLLISMAVASLIAFPGAVSFSQQQEMQKAPAKEGPGAPGREMPSGNMMEMHHPMTGPMQSMACPMMGMPMQGTGGMQGGMMRGMMGGMMAGMAQGMAGGDPKTMGRMLEMRGEMLMKIGEVMMKHAKMWQQESAK